MKINVNIPPVKTFQVERFCFSRTALLNRNENCLASFLHVCPLFVHANNVARTNYRINASCLSLDIPPSGKTLAVVKQFVSNVDPR